MRLIYKHSKDKIKNVDGPEPRPIQFMTVSQASSFLGLKTSYVYKLVSEHRIPVYKPFGGRLLFDREEIALLVRRGRISTDDELSKKSDTLLNSTEV